MTEDELSLMASEILSGMDDSIEHHGVKGMHWGIRNEKESTGRSRSSFSSSPSVIKKIKKVQSRISKFLKTKISNIGKEKVDDGNISKKDVKNLVNNYNRLHGTRYRVNSKTIITKDGVAYDSKGKRLDTSSKVTSTDKRTSADPGSTTSHNKPMSEMSDDQLRSAIGRMQLENQYKTLAQAAQPQEKKGNSLASKFLAASGDIAVSSFKAVGTQVATYYFAKAVNGTTGESIVKASDKFPGISSDNSSSSNVPAITDKKKK